MNESINQSVNDENDEDEEEDEEDDEDGADDSVLEWTFVTVCYLGSHTVESFLHSGNGMQEASSAIARFLLEWTPDASEVGSSIIIIFYAI